MQSLIGKMDHWVQLRKECYVQANNPKWRPFKETYELLDLDWFDKAYFDKIA